jgi:hypothetical protein
VSGGRGAEPGPFDVIAEALDEPAGRTRFMRGLMLGALVGAAVVGSVLRARQARRPRPRPVQRIPELETPGPAGETPAASAGPPGGASAEAPTV